MRYVTLLTGLFSIASLFIAAPAVAQSSVWEILDYSFSAVDKLSGLLIALVGLFFTKVYNRRQHQLSLLEATGKMIPHFKDETKDAAFVTLMSLAGSPKLIVSLADLYPGRAAAVACLDVLDEERDSRGLNLVRRPLFYSLYTAAAEAGELGVIELLEERLDKDERLQILNASDPEGRTALMNAAIYNRGGNIRKLAELGARIETADRGGETALHHAARYGNRDATKVLIEMIKAKVKAGEWTLDEATSFLDKENVRNKRSALELANYHASRPPDPERVGHYSSVARRLRHARETLHDL